jgi:putative salt-induced outer membrane protein YdiY
MKRYIYALGLGLAWSAQAGWESSMNAGANLTRGNSETSGYNAGWAAKHTNRVDQLSLELDGAYGKSAGETTTENVSASADYRKALKDSIYGYLNASFLYDRIAQVDTRLVVGPGLGITLVDRGGWVLGMEVGVAYITESLGTDAPETDDIALRVAQYCTCTLSPTATVWQKLEYMPLFARFDDYLLNVEIGIESLVAGDLSLRIVVSDRYDSTPATAEKNDLALRAGLRYSL